jgi:hypothetical protein
MIKTWLYSIRRSIPLLKCGFWGQTGFTLIENLVAVGILAAIGVVFMTALFTGYNNAGILNEKQTAEILIRSQLEDIKHGEFNENGIYPVTVEVPAHYSLTISVTTPTCIGHPEDCVPLDDIIGESVLSTIQEITVTASHSGKVVMAVACYKAIQ